MVIYGASRSEGIYSACLTFYSSSLYSMAAVVVMYSVAVYKCLYLVHFMRRITYLNKLYCYQFYLLYSYYIYIHVNYNIMPFICNTHTLSNKVRKTSIDYYYHIILGEGRAAYEEALWKVYGLWTQSWMLYWLDVEITAWLHHCHSASVCFINFNAMEMNIVMLNNCVRSSLTIN